MGGMKLLESVEQYALQRESHNHMFKWTKRNIIGVMIFGVGVPCLLVRTFVRDQQAKADREGVERPRFWGDKFWGLPPRD